MHATSPRGRFVAVAVTAKPKRKSAAASSAGKMEEARQMLAEIYGWFSEGFDTKDLQEAKVLLDELAEGR